MLLHSRHLAFSLLVVVGAACGDNKSGQAPPDGQPPDGNNNVCSLDLAASAVADGTWDTRFTVPGFTGLDGHAPTVYDFTRDTDGSILAAGEFRYVGSDHVAPLMRFKNGAWQPARTNWELTPPGAGFSAVAVAPDGKLALATYDDFGEQRSVEIWLDDGSGLRKIGGWSGLVRRLIWFDGKLWAAGWGGLVVNSNTALQGLAVWNGTAWSAPPGGSPTGFVFELVPDGNELLVGGYFDHVGGIAANSVAAYNGTTWRALSMPEMMGVYALARGADNQLYAGGAFGIANGNTDSPAGGMMVWDGTAWTLAGGGLGNRYNSGVVTDLALHDGSLYVSGCFVTAGGGMDAAGAIESAQIARFDGTWHALNNTTPVLGNWYEERKCGDEGVESVWDVSAQTVFSTGDRVLFGGSFPGIAGVSSQAIVSHDGTAWHPEAGTGGLGLNGSLDKIGASSSCDVWGMGQQITHVAGESTRARLFHFTGDRWTAISDSLPGDAYCTGFAVSPAGDVAIGCFVTADSGDTVGRVYRVSGTQLVQLGGDAPPIMTLAYDADNKLWIGGSDPKGAGYLARMDGETITMIEQGFDSAVNLIEPISANDVVVAGSFSKVGSVDVSRIARWNGSTWSALGAGLPATPTALAHDANTVYASTINEGAQYLLGAFDGTSWKELATPGSGLTPEEFFNFNEIKAIDGGVVAVGTAWLDNDTTKRGAIVYRNGKFEALGGAGVHAITLSGLAVTSDSIWVGGSIAEAGTATTTTPTVGVARYIIAH
ncbi:MAG: hypothetical protein HOV81_12645 [Kofleriaceae bacterium]|nr:hypothetical protein [Kofleriaceae bacterium]